MRQMNKRFYKIIQLQIIFFVVIFGFVQVALAGYKDVETSAGNSIGASNLDAEVVSEESELQLPVIATNMLLGASVTRTGNIENIGNSDFQYNVAFEKVSGDDELCDALQLEAKKDGVVAYDGQLSLFDFDAGNLIVNADNDWDFTVTLDSGVASDRNCEFKFGFTAWQTSFAEPTHGWVDTEEIDNNIIHTGLETPEQTGYNENDEDDPNSYPTPRDPNEFACTGGVTNINGISVHWKDVAYGNSDVKYQRQFNKVGSYGWSGNEIYTNPYTNYRTFGGNPGAEAVYGSRVRAWVDTNNNNVIDTNEMVSDWSNECYIEFDRTAPATPTGLRRLKREDNNIVYECGDTIPIQHVYPDWDDNTESDFDHYEYTSFNAPNGAIGLDEQIMYDSIFEYNGSWLPHDGTYGFAVRAVDKAGNKSDWALTGKNLAGSCQITYDSTGPESTIDAIEYSNGTIEPDKFVTNYTTPTIRGTVTDNAGVDWVKLTVNGHEYNAVVSGDEWEADVSDVLPDGIHELSIEAQDSLGNISTTQKNIHIDTKAPDAQHTYYKDGEEIENFHTYYENGHKFTGPIVYIDGDLSHLSFTGEYVDSDSPSEPSAGLYWDSYAIFQAQDDGSFRFSHDGKRAFCSWRRDPNLVDISDEATFSLTQQKSFADCVATLPDGEYYIAHHIYDYATRKDIPSINQFRDVLGLHFVVDTAPETPTGMRILDNEGNDMGCDGFVNNRHITVDWEDNGESDLDHYDYQIREATTIAHPTVSEYSGDIRDEDGYYKYRVRAVDERGNTSDWTGWCGVTLDRSAPSAPQLIEPVNEAVVDGDTLLSDWSDVDGAHHYIYESYHNASATNLRWHAEYTDSEKTAHNVADATFWWRVKAVDEAGNESDWSELWKVTIDNSAEDEDIALNEFMPMPAVGNEWVELYNNGDESVDVDGWYIADATGHRRKINKEHTKDNSTAIESKGFLVVQGYSNFSLNNDGDTVKLFNAKGDLIDSYKYKAKEVSIGKTIARNPDGVGDWVDPVPTPGEKNNPSNKKEDFRKYYAKKCFDGEELLCDEKFMHEIGLLEDKKEVKDNKKDEKIKGENTQKEENQEDKKVKKEQVEEQSTDTDKDKRELSPIKTTIDKDTKKENDDKVNEDGKTTDEKLKDDEQDVSSDKKDDKKQEVKQDVDIKMVEDKKTEDKSDKKGSNDNKKETKNDKKSIEDKKVTKDADKTEEEVSVEESSN